jgi:hypothetical protein
MFDRKYIIKVYCEGQNIPLLEFTVNGMSVIVDGHTLIIDGAKIKFSDKHYISVTN